MLIIVLNLHLLLSYYTNYNDIEHVEMYMYIYIFFYCLFAKRRLMLGIPLDKSSSSSTGPSQVAQW